MNLSGNIKIENIETFDLSGLGLSYDKGSFFADKRRGWYYQFDTGVSMGTLSDPMRLYRYNLDFTLEEDWSPDDTYGASQYGASYREGKPYYDEESGDFFAIMSVNDDILGGTPSPSNQYQRWVRWHIDQDNLDSTTVSIYSLYGGGEAQTIVRRITPIYIDIPKGKIYYQRGEVNKPENQLVKFDVNTNTTDVTFSDTYLEGNIKGFTFDTQQETLKGLLVRYGKVGTNVYDTVYFEFDFKTQAITFTASNTLVGFNFNDVDFNVYDDIIDTTIWTNPFNATQSIPVSNLGIQRYTFDKNLNLLDVRATSDPDTFASPAFLDKVDGEIIGFNSLGRFFRRFVEVQKDTTVSVISGDESYTKVLYDEDTNITGASNSAAFYVFEYDYAWGWGVGSGNGGTVSSFRTYDGYSQTLLHTIDFPEYETYFRSSNNEIYFDGTNTFINTLARRSDSSLRYVKIEVDLENGFSLTYSELGTVIAPNGATQFGASYNGAYRIFDYVEEDNLIYALNIGFSGNYGNGTNGNRFLKYDIATETNTFVSQNWRNNTPEITGRQYRFRDLRVDPLTEKITFPANNQEDGIRGYFAEYDYKNDILATYSFFQGSERIAYVDLDSSNYIFFTNVANKLTAYVYDNNTYELINEIQSEVIQTYINGTVYDQVTKDVFFAYSNVFQDGRYKRRQGLLQGDNTIPLYDDDRFEILATASTVSVFGTAGIIGGGNIDTMGFDEANDTIYILVNGQPSTPRAKVVKTDLDFNLIDTFDIDSTPYNNLDSREVKGFFDLETLTFYTLLELDSGGLRNLVRIEVDGMTLSSTTVSTIDTINPLGNGTFNYMFGVVDDILYWNHGYLEEQVGKELYFRTHNIATDTETSAVFLGTYSHITNYYFDQDNLSVYYNLASDDKRYKYDYNTLTSSVINPYTNNTIPRLRHLGTASVSNSNKLVGYPTGETFKEVTANYVSNTYMTNIDPQFEEGVIIEYISNDILYGYNGGGVLYKIRKK